MGSAIRQALILCLLALLPAVGQSLWRPVHAPLFEPFLWPDEISAERASQQQDLLWVDTRSREAYQRDAIAGAMLLNEQEWDALLPAVVAAGRPDQLIVVYGDGHDSASARTIASRLRNEGGFQRVYVLKGGRQAWQPKAR